MARNKYPFRVVERISGQSATLVAGARTLANAQRTISRCQRDFEKYNPHSWNTQLLVGWFVQSLGEKEAYSDHDQAIVS